MAYTAFREVGTQCESHTVMLSCTITLLVSLHAGKRSVAISVDRPNGPAEALPGSADRTLETSRIPK